MSVQVTERAAQEFKSVLDMQGLSAENTYLRLGVKGGGCSGFSYSLDLTQTKGEHDEEIEQHGVKCICDPKSLLYLNGVTLDFSDDLTHRGFVFHNPNASHTCGCGNSFSA